MAKTVAEVIEEDLKAKRNDKGEIVYNRFSKKGFNKLLTAMANDPECGLLVAKVKGDELESLEEMKTFGPFRQWCKKLVEKLGVDKAESEKVLSSDFVIDNMDGFYEFMSTAIYKYIEAGNKFDMIPTEDFKGSLFIEEVGESDVTAEVKNVSTKESMGMYRTVKKPHKKLKVKSSCPKYLTTRTKV